jgi:hypothetical protein
MTPLRAQGLSGGDRRSWSAQLEPSIPYGVRKFGPR